MGGSQSNAVSSDIEVGNIGKADRKTPTRSCGFLVIIEADCDGIVEQEMGIDLGKPKNEAEEGCL
jgi:hypothetical protein